MEWRVRIVNPGYSFTSDVYITRKVADGIEIMRGTTIETIEEGAAFCEPSFRLDREVLQAFATELNQIGVSAEKEYVVGRLESTEDHLDDLRQILKIKGRRKAK